MTFLQPFILWGLPLLLIPVIIHLLNRLRHRPQPWGAMRFLQAANRSSISQAKLRQLLVLLFRVLAVAALVLFLSRPMAGGWLGWALSPAPEVVVLVLDRSASMETQAGNSGRSRREQAVALWADALKAYPSSRTVLIESATQTAQELPGVSALAQPAFTGPTDTRADLPALLQRAFNYLSESKSGAAEVWIASDLQESNWAPGDPQWERVMAQFAALSQKVRFRLLSFAGEARNASLNLVEAVRRTRGSQRQLQVVLDVQSQDTFTEPVVLRWNLGGNSSQTELKLPGQSLRWRNSFPLPAANEPGWGAISLSADANLADNQIYFAYDVERIPSALVVSAHPERARPLQLAASDLSRGVAERARIIPPADFASTPLTNTALIVWHAAGLPGAAPDILADFVNAGGALLFLPEADPGALAFSGLAFAEITAAKADSPLEVTRWNELDGPLARTDEGYGVPLGSLEVFQRASISGGGTVLASFSDGAPFLVRKAIGKGEVYFCATSAQPEWSALADGAVLVPMLQRMIQTGARRLNAGVMLDCGDAATREGEKWARADGGAEGNPRLQAGVYKAGGRFLAVNRPSAENDPAALTGDQARALFRDVPFQMHQERGRSGDRLQGEIWRIFLTLMLIFLVLEGLLILPPKTAAPAPRGMAPARQPAEAAA